MIFHQFRRLGTLAWRCRICLYLLLALFSGALLPIQANFNAQLARSLDSVPLAAAISYLVGTVVLIVMLSTGQFGHPNWSALPQSPRWSLMGGVLGAWYISSSTFSISVLGTTPTLGLVVGGQAIAGIVTDHFGWLNLPQHRLTRPRRLAIGLLIGAIFFLTQPR